MATLDKQQKDKGLLLRGLSAVERVGNRLPHPVTIFALLTLLVILLSHLFALMGVTVQFEGINPETMKTETQTVSVESLLVPDGIRYMVTSIVENFTTFVALGPVLVAMIGVGVAERSGYLAMLLKRIVIKAPKRLVTPTVVLMGIMSNIAASVGYVVLVPLGAIIFLGFKRHPLAGMAAAFAGVSGGYSANLLIGTNDPILAGISTEAARILNANVVVDPTANWYFMIVSTFILVFIGTWVTDKIVEPRLGPYREPISADIERISQREKRAFRWANLSLLVVVLIIALSIIPSDGVLRGEGGSVVNSPFIQSIIVFMMVVFLIPGLVYGALTGVIKNDKDAAGMMSDSLASMAGFILLIFISAQFVAFFNHTHLGTLLSVKGAEFLQASGFVGIPLMVTFILLTAVINLFIAADSAKWAIMAPIFIPMFMQLGYSPELTQVAYRIGDSTTNIIAPLMPFFALIVAFAQKYDRKSGIGTVVSLMLPYSLLFLLFWIVLLIIWYFLGLPLGPGAPLFM
ncbi:AbgT family transporter [Desmospora activa]|uniref:AbgT family transporter n=1 Tax=Desmospora activa TaxID=500615 RepID=UPI003CCBD193